MPTSSFDIWQRFFFGWASFLVVVAFLYWTQAVIIPIVVAILITFVLSPLVNFLQRKGMGRTFPTLLVVSLAVAVVAGIFVGVLFQLRGLAVELPEHKDEIVAKIRSLREAGKGSWLDKVIGTAQYINEQINPAHSGQEPVPVTVETSNLPGLRLPALLERAISPALEGMVGAGLVVVLVIFMVIHREKLRNRLLRLLAGNSLSSATRAVDDASRRISRFLFMQLVINVAFGAAMALGLYLLGIPYAFLWGCLGAALRYIPFLGSLIAGALPVLLSVAILPGWLTPVLVCGYILTLELLTGNVLEPLLYGQSIGVSEVALLIAAAFWAWLWGPIGLMLSTPLMACLAVLGRYVPQFEFFHVLLGDSPILDTYLSLYQRLLARDSYEAAELVEDYVATHSAAKACEDVLVPALSLVQQNRDHDELTAAEEAYILQTTRGLVDDLLPSADTADKSDPNMTIGEPAKQTVILGCPARDDADKLALEMFGRLPSSDKWRLQIASSDLLFSEIIALANESKAAVVLIAVLSQNGLPNVRYLCKRLRGQAENMKVVVAWWGLEHDLDHIGNRLHTAGADHVVTSFSEAFECLAPLAQFLTHASLPSPVANGVSTHEPVAEAAVI